MGLLKMPRFNLPLTDIDFTCRVNSDTGALAKATYIQNGFVKQDTPNKVYNRPAVVEDSVSTNIHHLAMADHQSGVCSVGYNSSTGVVAFYINDTPTYTITGESATRTFYGVSLIPIPSDTPFAQDYFIKLYQFTGGAGYECWRVVFGSGLVAITDADRPVSVFAGAAALDGYVFLLATQGTDPSYVSIYNSDQGDPTSWDSLGFINTDMKGGYGVGIDTYKNHVIVFGTNNIQLFYDAGNPAPGSPLAPRQDLVYNFGLPYNFPGSPRPWWKSTNGDILTFIGRTFEGKQFIGMFNEYTVEKISNTYIEGLLEAYPNGTSIAGYDYYGKTFIHICINSSLALYYDTETKLWHVFSSQIPNLLANYRIIDSVKSAVTGVADSTFLTYAPGNTSGTAKYGRYMNFRPPTDIHTEVDRSATAYTLDMVIQTPKYYGNEDGWRSQRKFMSELELLGDTLSANRVVYLSFTDDDYSNFSAARNIDMSIIKKQLTKLGQFRERAFKLLYQGVDQARLELLEGQVTTGTN